MRVFLVLLLEGSLVDQEVGQAVRENVDRELDWVVRVRGIVLDDRQRQSLDELWSLRDTGRLSVYFHQIQGSLAWEQDLYGIDLAEDKFSLAELFVLDPRHCTHFRELLRLATEEVAAILNHVLFMTLEEVVDEVVCLRRVSQKLLVGLLKLNLTLCL